ncbi:MAG: LPS-assembly protein LptD [Treponema sp.]|jgi:hypothetical protein|nr:LPS-assembly protein LptD [Treponema sp.]
MKGRHSFFIFIFFIFCAGFSLAAQEGESPGAGVPDDPPAEAGLSADGGEEAGADADGDAVEGAETAAEEEAGLSADADADADAVEGTEIAAEEEDPELKRIAMDIKTSSLMELAAWARSLNLSEGGTREELAGRLRDHYRIRESLEPPRENQKIITIEKARSTEYFTLEVVDEEYARLRGGVVVSLKDGEAVHRIQAQEILYNKTRNIMSASGDVEYVKTEGDSIETFRGQKITVNLDNWSSVFLEGLTEKGSQSDETVYRFSGNVISRNDEEVTVLRKAEISNASNSEAFWTMNASKLWLLPGSDFAIFNGVLKVGEIPVLYIPFFYYPADEMIFHPVIGLRSREGSFLQTSTYILGRPKIDPSTESSISRILGSGADMEKERQGVWLKSTGKKKENKDEISLKALVDYYTNLGTYVGTELNMPRKGIFGVIDLSAGLGFSRTVVRMPENENSYTPFAWYDGTSDWNSSRFISWDIPFRYRFTMSGSLGGTYGSFAWAFPYYSDPFMDRDFLKRSEEMDWIGLGKDGARAVDEEEEEQSLLSAYEWRLNGSFNPSVTFLNPYVNSFSISNLTSTVAFRERDSKKLSSTSTPSTGTGTGTGTGTDTGTGAPDSAQALINQNKPDRKFYFPDKFTVYSLGATITGTPFSLGAAPSVQNQYQNQNTQNEEKKDPFADIGIPRSPFATGEDTQISSKDRDPQSPPALNQRFDLQDRGHRFSIDYRFSPSSASELQFRNDLKHWREQDQIDWSEVSSILSIVKGDAGTTFTLEHTNSGLYSNAFTISGTGSWQDYNYMNEDAEEFVDETSDNGLGFTSSLIPPKEKTEEEKENTKIAQAKKRNYDASFWSTSYENVFTLRPFFWDAVFGTSNIQYAFKGIIAKSKFTGTGLKPEWETEHGAWKKKYLDSHTISTNFNASVMDKMQNLTLAYELPPREESFSGNMTLRAWILEANAHTRIVFPKPEEEEEDANTDTSYIPPPVNLEEFDYLRFEPLYLTGKLSFGKWGSFQQYIVYDYDPHEEKPEEKIGEVTTLTSTFNVLNALTVAYTATRQAGYVLEDTGWVQSEEEPTLKNRDINISFSKTYTKQPFWKKRFGFTVNNTTSLLLDLQRYTNSSLTFNFGFNMSITNFLDLSFSSTTTNSVVFRYLQKLPFFHLSREFPEGEQNNFFTDLVNSFRFDDDAKRRSSGFKLKSFNFSATHHLGDWNAVLGITLSPYLDQENQPYSYKFNNEISFMVKWVPVSEIKTEIEYKEKQGIDNKWTIR